MTYTASRGYPEIVRLLLAHGADTPVVDRHGWMILDHPTWRAVQPASADDLAAIVPDVGASRTADSDVNRAAVIALLRR